MNQVSVQEERLRRQSVVARQQIEDKQPDETDQEQEDAEEQKQEEAEQDRTHFLLHALDVRRKHIAEAEYYVAEEKRTKPTLWGYMPAFVLAIAKDGVFDAIFFIPGLNLVVTFFFGIAMFITLYLIKTNRSLFQIKKIAVFLIGLIVGFIPLLALLPEQITLVFFIFLIDKAESNEKIAKGIQLIENIADLKHRKK